MKLSGVTLFLHEQQALIDALRRDLKMEMSHYEKGSEWAEYHYFNVRLNMRLLELLESTSPFGHNEYS
jgi:hypothetical protein